MTTFRELSDRGTYINPFKGERYLRGFRVVDNIARAGGQLTGLLSFAPPGGKLPIKLVVRRRFINVIHHDHVYRRLTRLQLESGLFDSLD